MAKTKFYTVSQAGKRIGSGERDTVSSEGNFNER